MIELAAVARPGYDQAASFAEAAHAVAHSLVTPRRCALCAWSLFAVRAPAQESQRATVVVPVAVTSPRPQGATPISVELDFAEILRKLKLPGVVDPNTITVHDPAKPDQLATVPHALHPRIRYGDKAAVQWISRVSSASQVEIRFRTAEKRPFVRPRSNTPLIGLGDLLRYAGPTPQPLGASLATRLIDVDGDGLLDLVATDYYTTEPLWPERIPQSWCPFMCYPGVVAAADPFGESSQLRFGDAIRFRYRDKPDAPQKFFVGGYMHCDVSDLNGDKLPDLAFAAAEKSSADSQVPDVADYIHIYLNTGKADAGGMPELVYADRVAHPKGNWGPVRIVDLDGDGSVDFVVGSLFSETNPRAYFIRNTNPAGWPFRAAPAAAITPGAMASFLDLDGDGVRDSVCVTHDERWGKRNFCSRVAWRKGLGGSPPQFGAEQPLTGVDDELCEFVSTVETDHGRGVLVSAGYIGERIIYYELQPAVAGSPPRFLRKEALSENAPLRAGDQPTPSIVDWNDDGAWDLLYGGGFGWIRVFLNEGTNETPKLVPGIHALSEGKPINLHMTQFFPGIENYWHDLGYVHPSFVDWDGDGLRDLVVSNVGNRIYWYRNVGKHGQPTFGPRLQVICDGYEETPERTTTTARRLGAGGRPQAHFPPDQSSSPFWWRARAGFGDLNGDGLVDMITADADSHASLKSNYVEGLSLFVQYVDAEGRRRLKRDHLLTLPDGDVSINVRYQPSQTIVHDWDGDGLLDLVVNDGRTMDTAPAVLRNIGTRAAPKFDFAKRLACYGEELSGLAKHGPYYGVGDMDGDGRADLIASMEVGTYTFFRRTALDLSQSPTIKIGEPRVQDAAQK
ncbi:MAG: VCBS repeat-containing protein [Pirellulales bacterium]